MKPNIHPNYKKFKIKIGSDVFETYSTHPAGEILMDVDYRKHPAWTGLGATLVNSSNKNIAKFNDKFSGLSFMVKN